ncbi:MAG: AAA family ATPase [Aeriscardovia sp.]|nr:AAA family ATPase [Aeriscardovia sp.]
MEEKQFTWIPFYKELAKALLIYKDNRKPLVDWIYSELSKVGSSSLVDYLKEDDGSKIVDIDPFSVFAIFNRSLRVDNRTSFLQMFKEKFGLISEVPTDFDGIPTVNSMRAFFFSWDTDNVQRIPDLWDLFEAAISDKNISTLFDKVIEDGVPRISLTMVLYWISPDKYLNLDKRNSGYLRRLGFEDKYSNLNYEQYSKLIDDVRYKMKEINCSSFPELSYKAWSESNAERLWMFNGDSLMFSSNILKMGELAKGQLQFEQFKTKVELGNAYRSIASNKDVRVPLMYWEFMHDVKIGDIVVIFGTKKEKGKQWHLLYGWGKFVSDYKLDYSDDNPIQREVEWNLPILQEPIEEKFTKNALYFHDVDGINAANIRSLLGINKTAQVIMEKSTNNKYVQLLKTNKNLILTGAPGTGKTHLAKEIAKEMLGVESVEALSKDKRFGFVQFHPSYDYTDFVEGLRPTKDKNGNVCFERKDGVFKEFCKQAILSETTDADILSYINTNPTVWKVSLEGTGDNPTRKDCMENGYIRIGWHNYGDVEDFNDYDNFSDGGKNVLRAFQSSMQIGDLVVSCYSAKEIDAVGVITGEYEYRADGGHYPRYRTVKWLVKDIRENIIELNKNKPFTLSTIYKANIKAEAVLKIVQKYSANIAEVVRKDIAVFVIDEINRGEISKIFGELFFSIDPGYRGNDGIVKTQYQNMIDEGDAFKDGFYVPENVYIIGTMNDIDRSVESMDFAMRRRFAWEEVTAEESIIMLNGIENEAEIKARMISLNNAIAKIDVLGTQYQIGAAYFKKIADNKENFQELWDYHLKGLLYEYLRGSRDVKSQMDKLEKAYNRVNPDEPVD